MGTVISDSLDFYQKCICAFAGTEYQVIISVGNSGTNGLNTIPENITVKRFVDQIAVLQKADVFLSHCGMNSVNESLYYRVPLVMYPQTTEQSGVAARVAQLGAGIQLKKVTTEGIREAVEHVLNTPSYRNNAAAISDGFKKCSGVKGAADKILSLCQSV